SFTMNSSLLLVVLWFNLVCAHVLNPQHEAVNKTDSVPKASITYTVQVFDNKKSTIKVDLRPYRPTFFDVMKTAQEEDNRFRFTYKRYWPFGAYVTSIGGVKEDTSKQFVWMFYKCNKNVDPAVFNDMKGCKLSDTGVSWTYPEDGDIYLFHYEHHPWDKTIKQL
ncbi:unnamed protein product, partial [Meganyctiphanes norvegica]